VQVSGTPVVRPRGQHKDPTDDGPSYGPSRRLDIEAEVGFVVGTPSPLGTPVPLSDFADHAFGVCLVDDWAARDIQAWEYVPLGHSSAKSFLTSVCP
jgi:fumarylacetoacetase